MMKSSHLKLKFKIIQNTKRMSINFPQTLNINQERGLKCGKRELRTKSVTGDRLRTCWLGGIPRCTSAEGLRGEACSMRAAGLVRQGRPKGRRSRLPRRRRRRRSRRCTGDASARGDAWTGRGKGYSLKCGNRVIRSKGQRVLGEHLVWFRVKLGRKTEKNSKNPNLFQWEII